MNIAVNRRSLLAASGALTVSVLLPGHKARAQTIGAATRPPLDPRNLSSYVTIKADGGARVTRVHPGTKAEAAGLKVGDVIRKLMGMWMMVTMNQTIDYETAAVVAVDLGFDPDEQESEASSAAFTSKDGFSVVAPISTMSPASTLGRNASCWALLKR